MTLKPLGDSAWLVEFVGESALGRIRRWVHLLEKSRPAGVRDIVASYASVAVHFDVAAALPVRDWLEAAMEDPGDEEAGAGKFHEVPVCYEGDCGPDLQEVAERTGLSVDEVIALHSGADYTVAAVGFSPGFPYLSGLPEHLRLPRRSSPRTSVPAGSVAIAGGQAGIYPFASPGGWHVIGRTNLELFNPLAERPALMQPGDRVRFRRVSEWSPAVGGSVETLVPTSDRWAEVIHPGAATTVQDFGRPGYESAGISPGGAVDPMAMRIANLLIGNDEDAAVLEICLSGPVMKFNADAVVALTGHFAKPQAVKAGEVVDFSKLTAGVRACLAIAGGWQVPRVLGSAATDPRAGFGGFGGRVLKCGDRLEFGHPQRAIPRGDGWHVGWMAGGRAPRIELRFVPGVQESWFSAEARHRFRTEFYQITPMSDRMGARLSGPALELATPREMVSQPVVCGSVQVPPDGQPIVLLAGRQTIGGYPQIGHVISADLPKLARAWPGTRVSFCEVTCDEARELLRREERELAWLRAGLELLKSNP